MVSNVDLTICLFWIRFLAVYGMRGKEVSDIVGNVTNRLRMESFFTALLVLELTLFSTL